MLKLHSTFYLFYFASLLQNSILSDCDIIEVVGAQEELPR